MNSIIRLLNYLWSLIEGCYEGIEECKEKLDNLSELHNKEMADPDWKFSGARFMYTSEWYDLLARISNYHDAIKSLHAQIGIVLDPDANCIMDNAHRDHKRWYADQISKINRESYRKCGRKHSEIERSSIRKNRKFKHNMMVDVMENLDTLEY
jgi:hypothetical protein